MTITAATMLIRGHLVKRSIKLIVHFRVSFCLCFKTSLSAKPFISNEMTDENEPVHILCLMLTKCGVMDKIQGNE